MKSYVTRNRDPNAPQLSRRQTLGGISAVASLAAHGAVTDASSATNLPRIRQLTHSSRHHWFGYYDKLEFDPSNRFILSNEVSFAGRTATPDDQIGVGMVGEGVMTTNGHNT